MSASPGNTPAAPAAPDAPADGPSGAGTVAVAVAAALAGAGAGVLLLPGWLPGLAASLLGGAPQAFWFLARSSAFVAYFLLWLSVVFGLLITTKASRAWPGAPVAYDLHQFTALLGLGFAAFHALVLLGDRYIGFTPASLLVPFGAAGYRPFWTGLGQVGLLVMLAVTLSFSVRRWIGRRAWRVLHFLSFALFVLVLGHGLGAGSDAGAPWARLLYWSTGTSVVFLTAYRTLLARAARAPRAPGVVLGRAEQPDGGTRFGGGERPGRAAGAAGAPGPARRRLTSPGARPRGARTRSRIPTPLGRSTPQ